ncbi:MAG: hypothetical protein HYU68_04550 [Bacteroidetes bacterium]|nr:hypothetical protein [Bacteroidota bacterium]
MAERITINHKDNSIEIEIKAFKDKTKQKMLLVWIVLFSLCGLAILSQFFYGYDKSSQLFFAVYLAFWLFFEFKVIYAYRWRNAGMEKIIINETEINLIKEIGKRGITQTIKINEISNLRCYESDESSFIKSITSSYWNINKYSLAFDYENKPVPFAIDLDKNEAKKLLKEMVQFIKTN